MVSVAQEGEKNLLLRLQDGDERAFRVLYDLYSGAIYGKLVQMMTVEHLADELLQETFVTLWEKKHTLDPALSLKPWLYRVAQNKVYHFYRKVARDIRLQKQIIETFAQSYFHTEEALYFKESKELLDQAIERLPPQRRKVFILCRIEGKSYQEAAALLGVSPSTVSNQLVKATETVRRYMFGSNETTILLLAAFSAWVMG